MGVGAAHPYLAVVFREGIFSRTLGLNGRLTFSFARDTWDQGNDG